MLGVPRLSIPLARKACHVARRLQSVAIYFWRKPGLSHFPLGDRRFSLVNGNVRACLDIPVANDVLGPASLLFEGWSVGPSSSAQLSRVEVWAEGVLLATTRHWFARNDVTAALALPDAIKPGFAIGLFPPDLPLGRCSFELRFFEGERQVGTLERTITFGEVSSAPPRSATAPARHPSCSSLQGLIARTLATVHDRIVELECGTGDVGRFLCQAGLHWHGIEGRHAACEVLAAIGLPFVRPTGQSSPYRTGGFDFALGTDLAPDILESWLPEIRRLARRGVLLSGPLEEVDARQRSERLLSHYLRRCEVMPYRTADNDTDPTAGYDRWFLFALDWQHELPALPFDGKGAEDRVG